MDREQVKQKCRDLFEQVPGNILDGTDRIPAGIGGTALFDSPLVGFGASDDELFDRFKEFGVIGPWHMGPEEWLPDAKTVISLFFPMSGAVLESNRAAEGKASALWTCARVEGQEFISAYTEALRDWFREQGYGACAPCIDPRFESVSGGQGIDGYPGMDARTFGSRWSERHVAFACGLGTFGLSAGLITRRGIAGRFTSVIVTALLGADVRPYTGVYEYCSRCGACVRRCPAGAISLESGKDHVKCRQFLKESKVIHYPRYGCGLCQTGVPCEHAIPSRTGGSPGK